MEHHPTEGDFIMETINDNIIEEAIKLLSSPADDTDSDDSGHHEYLLPSIEKLKEIVELLRSILFPGYKSLLATNFMVSGLGVISV